MLEWKNAPVYYSIYFIGSKLASQFLGFRIAFKSLDHVRGQGAGRFKSGAYTLVREHFETARNAVLGH